MATVTREEIFGQVQSVCVDALGVDAEEVKGESTLTGDLGAESIDFLDIVFRVERRFGMKIPRGDLFPENFFSDPQFVSSDKVTTKGLLELHTRMPWGNFDRFKEGPNVQDLFTVEMIANYVESKINAPGFQPFDWEGYSREQINRRH